MGEAILDIVAGSAAMPIMGGLGIGMAFGAIVGSTNFCTMGAISDIVLSRDYRRFRSWVLAAAIALIGAQSLAAIGAVDLRKSLYLTSGFNGFGSIFGGLIFGLGMVLAGGCPSRNIAKAGAGDLRALVSLIVVGLTAYVTIGGLLAPARIYAANATMTALPAGVTPALGDLAAHLSGYAAGPSSAVLATLIAAAALIYCCGDAAFRTSPRHVLAGAGVGLCAVAGWAVTGMSFDEFARAPSGIASLSFVRPVGDAIEYLARFTAIATPSFGVASVGGALLGAMAAAIAMGRFRVSGFAGDGDTARNLAGASLMGVGGVLALGCSIGQGVTGISTLALGAFLAFAAIVAGAVLGVKYLERVSAG